MAKPNASSKKRTVSAGRTSPGKYAVGLRRTALKPRLQFKWARAINSEQWELYRAAMNAVRAAGIPFMLGGGFSMAIYTGRWRNTKDIDLYIRQEDREAAAAVLAGIGFQDYFRQLPYDRKWIYRSTRDGVIVDLIWGMANQRAQVDDHWFSAAPAISFKGESLSVIPIEEFVWCKLYIMQRDHCDWTDVLNVLYAAGPEINWDHLLWRLEDDWPLLKALLSVYGWLCPRQAILLPAALRERLRLEPPEIPKHQKRDRIRLLDSRNWFAAKLPPDKPLEV
ncbi:MAG: nucleotidyltransferase [Verrucomicrobiota bacterium]